MNTANIISPVANDQFEAYFTEKLWRMIPSIYRHEDGLAQHPGVLRSLVEIMARQAAILRRSHDRLWEDQFIELCSDWAVPYLADLLGTRLVAAQNLRGRRVDVAKTIYYRRRKGTVRILEELISDITDWEGKVVENFRRLARNRHGLDPEPFGFRGQFSQSMPGGWADLRSARISELASGPFDEYHHTADLRRPKGKQGWYGIHKLGFHLYRLKAFRVEEVTPFSEGDQLSFAFDPSGRRIQLFMPRNRTESWDEWRSVFEWELPGPIRCRLLGHANYRIDGLVVQQLQNFHGLSLSAAADLGRFVGQEFASEISLRTAISSPDMDASLTTSAIYLPLLRLSLVEQCGKAALLPQSVPFDDPRPHAMAVHAPFPEGIIPSEQSLSGNLENLSISLPPDKRLIIDPEKGRFRFVGPPLLEEPEATYYYGFSGNIGAGTYDRSFRLSAVPDIEIPSGGGTIPSLSEGINQVNDNKTYDLLPSYPALSALHLRAANQRRPYLRIAAGDNWVIDTGANEDTFLTLEGLWIGAPGGQNSQIILRGDYECVRIIHCTFDPGGDENILEEEIAAVPLIIEGEVEQLIIESSIMGPVQVDTNGLIESMTICDSIIQSVEEGVSALNVDLGTVHSQRVSILGAVQVHRLYATDTLITGLTEVNDTQNGCFRFSLAPSGSILPKPYPHPPIPFDEANHWFVSQRYGHAGYAQLTETAPLTVRTGAENGDEIGAFNHLINSIKLESLKAKIGEYMPFGLLPFFINET